MQAAHTLGSPRWLEFWLDSAQASALHAHAHTHARAQTNLHYRCNHSEWVTPTDKVEQKSRLFQALDWIFQYCAAQRITDLGCRAGTTPPPWPGPHFCNVRECEMNNVSWRDRFRALVDMMPFELRPGNNQPSKSDQSHRINPDQSEGHGHSDATQTCYKSPISMILEYFPKYAGSCLSDWVTLFLMTGRDARSHKHAYALFCGGGESHSGAVQLEHFLDEWDVTTALPDECPREGFLGGWEAGAGRGTIWPDGKDAISSQTLYVAIWTLFGSRMAVLSSTMSGLCSKTESIISIFIFLAEINPDNGNKVYNQIWD